MQKKSILQVCGDKHFSINFQTCNKYGKFNLLGRSKPKLAQLKQLSTKRV